MPSLKRAVAGEEARMPSRRCTRLRYIPVIGVRATKRSKEHTTLDGCHDVVICGASFAGLAVARELAGSGANVIVLDRYEIGERQTSACGVPTDWLRAIGLMRSELQRFDSLVMHTPSRTVRFPLPWTFSTFDYRELCRLLWRDCDARFETAVVFGRKGGEDDELIEVETDRGTIAAPLVVDALGWRRLLAGDSGYQPPDAPLTRGLEVHPGGRGEDMELWIDRSYAPAGYSWSFPADDELRIGVCSFAPRIHVRAATDRLSENLGKRERDYHGNWIPHKLRPATEDGVFFVGDSAGHCLPLSAEGIRPALYFGIALGRELRAVVEGRKQRTRAAADYAEFSDSHGWRFRWMLRIQRLVPRIPPRLLAAVLPLLSWKILSIKSFELYMRVAPPEFATDVERPQPASSFAASQP